MLTQSDHYDAIILGAGAAGFLCAMTAAKRGQSVLLLEKSNKAGKKILMSGGGRCNFTNLYVEPDNYVSANPHFCIAALSRYTPWDFIAMVEQHNIEYEERKHGQLFCVHSAKDILNMLVDECERAGVVIETHVEVDGMEALSVANEARYALGLTQSKKAGDATAVSMTCRSLVIATGALSIPTLGGSGLGYDIADQFGLEVLPQSAGLVPLMFSDALKTVCERLAGTSLDVELSCNGQSFTESMLFTHRGLSGPAVLQISNYWRPGDEIHVDLLPGTPSTDWLVDMKANHGASLLKTVLAQKLPRSVVKELATLWWPESDHRALAEFSDSALSEIGSKLNQWRMKPSATEGYRTAEVTLGGIDTNGISSKTMESNSQPGLFFIGEVLDVSGHLGGFNFQWAWASGYAAGLFV
ncbi:MAG: putative Rossmann fold flavoprotein [Candidatus Azotimanducaceae bacterium]|jgi:predicted Rossmann fold flavoprotein